MTNDYTQNSLKYYNLASSSSLSDEIMYEIFSSPGHDFPYYDLGSVLQKYLIQAGADINSEENLKGFCTGKCIRFDTLKKILANECSLSRLDAIKLCFFFNLTPDEADILLRYFRHCSFHYRSFDDLIYAVCLKEKHSFSHAKAIVDYYKQIYSCQPQSTNNLGNRETPKRDRNINYSKQAISEFIINPEQNTSIIKELISKHDFSLDSLKEFLNNGGKKVLSEISLTTTKFYFDLIDDLKIAFEDPFLKILYEYLDENHRFSNTDICNLISSGIHAINSDNPKKELLSLDNKGFSPNPQELAHFRSLRKRISRNNLLVVLLLHISTIELSDWQSEWDEFDEEEKIYSQEKYCFNKAAEHINNALEKCNFPPLHPRVPLDYMILCSLTSENPHKAFTDTWKSFVEKP